MGLTKEVAPHFQFSQSGLAAAEKVRKAHHSSHHHAAEAGEIDNRVSE